MEKNKTLFAQIHCESRDGVISRMDKNGDLEYLKEVCRQEWINAEKPYLIVISDVENNELFRRPERQWKKNNVKANEKNLPK